MLGAAAVAGRGSWRTGRERGRQPRAAGPVQALEQRGEQAQRQRRVLVWQRARGPARLGRRGRRHARVEARQPGRQRPVLVFVPQRLRFNPAACAVGCQGAAVHPPSAATLPVKPGWLVSWAAGRRLHRQRPLQTRQACPPCHPAAAGAARALSGPPKKWGRATPRARLQRGQARGGVQARNVRAAPAAGQQRGQLARAFAVAPAQRGRQRRLHQRLEALLQRLRGSPRVRLGADPTGSARARRPGRARCRASSRVRLAAAAPACACG